jgi:hypothetical protein
MKSGRAFPHGRALFSFEKFPHLNLKPQHLTLSMFSMINSEG